MNPSPVSFFQSEDYLRHNRKRLEHLASLGLDIENKTVLEVGAGIGDHTFFYLERGCEVTSVEARPENLEILKKRYPEVKTLCLNLDEINYSFSDSFDVIHCYGLLYHLQNPAEALEFLARSCKGILLLETCVSLGSEAKLNSCDEPISVPTQSFTGIGCRPTRKWVFEHLKRLFNHVYIPRTQPDHEEFPTDWNFSEMKAPYARSVFIGSNFPIRNALLVDYLTDTQVTYKSEQNPSQLNNFKDRPIES